MKSISRYFLVVIVLASMLLGACAGAPAAGGAGKVNADSVAFTGTVDSISGNQWIVNGQMITVDPSVIKDGPFNVGDTIKVEVNVNQDGTFTVTRVEVPSSTDLSSLPQLGNDNSNGNTNDANSNGNTNEDNSNLNSNGNINEDNSNLNSNEDNSNLNSNGNTNDDHGGNSNNSGSNSNGSNGNGDNSNSGNEVFGVLQAMTPTSITVDGQTYNILPGGEVKGSIQVGDFVQIHLIQNADGTFSVREVGLSDPSQGGNGNGNEDNSNNSNSNNSNDNDNNSNGNSNAGGGNSNGGGGNHNGGGGGGGNDNGGGGGGGGGGGNDNGGGGNSNG